MPRVARDFRTTEIKRETSGDYAQAFDLGNIEFENGVVRRAPASGGAGTGNAEDRQAPASTYSSLPTATTGTRGYPNFPGRFNGIEMHAHHYIDIKTPHGFTGKRILVVGPGNSAADIAVELSSKSLQNTLTLSTRWSGAWIVPKYYGSTPADKFYRTSPHIPLKWQRKLLQTMIRMVGRPEDFGLPTPNHKFFEAHPTQSLELPLRLGPATSSLSRTSAVSTATPVHFDDGTSGDFDIIIYATGYNITFRSSTRSSSARRTTASTCTSACSTPASMT